MIRSISFLKGFIPLIKSGKKTITRRIKFSGIPGNIFYFKVGRFGKKEGYIKICNVMKVRLKDIRGDVRELDKEDFYENYPECFTRFVCLWDFLNDKKGCRWADDPTIYRIKFEYLGESFKYAIEVLRTQLREICAPVLVEVYPDLTKNGKRAFKRNFKNQVKELKQAIKILESENK